ncbi:MAG: radical SAM protein, partial [Desulfobacteraceae bacterium]|nr:radical SAM protein [Desulfobacteraceae bacterium]
MKNTDTRYIIKLPPPFLEQKKNEFLAALYERKFQAAEQIYIDIVSHAKALSKFSENDEKLLNQIQGTFKKFKPLLSKNVSSKFKEYNNHLKKLILTYIKNSSANIQHVDFLNWEVKLGLNSHQKELVYKTAMTFQLSSGCSNFCRRCNEWALPKIRSHFSYQAILKIIDHMVDQKNDEISLYGASDPLDWKHDNKTIFNVLQKIKKFPIECSILTKVPKGKEPLLKTLIKHKA